MASKRRSSSYRSSEMSRTASFAPERAGPSAPEAEEQAAPAPMPTIRDKDRIGDILRRVREYRGEEIEDISDYLRIRPSFLMALEESRYDKIPADAYAVGFLRTYALYLGLDGKGAVEQYRREMAGRRRSPQLTMPQPMSEGRIPSLAILLGAVFVALLVYGLWYALATPDRDILAEPIPLPAKTEDLASTPAGEALSATPAGDILLETTSAAALVPLVPPGEEPIPEDLAPPPQEPAQQEQAQTDPETPQLPPEPASYGAKGKARVFIQAEKESWVLITDRKGLTLFERTLKPGEIYYVPPMEGLRLTTGHASAIRLSLDGKPLPKMTTKSQVVRGVLLDPDQIRERLANSDEELPSAEE